MKRLLIVALALAALAAGACASASAASPRQIGIRIHYSRFAPSRVEVPVGVPIIFTLVNDDPIDHEWLIGDAAFHARHRTGTEAAHADRPDEVSLPPMTTRTTTLTFAKPGELTFVCHFPGHEAYGMAGVVVVKP